jgi:dienelactone hydrolase
MSVVRPVRLIGTLTFLMLSITVAAHAEELRPETVWIPMTDHDSAGAAYELHLEATLYRPSKPEPFPVLLFNHGSTGGMRRLPTKTLRYPSVAQFFVERGFRHDPDASWPRRFRRRVRRVVRLHSGSAVGWRRARDRRCGTGADVPAQTVMGDPTRLVLGGMSRGGFLSVVYPSVHPVNARGIINFSGGWAADWCNTAFNEEMFGRAGRATLPMLWLYTENDRNYGPASIRAYHRAFTSAGGSAQLQLYPPIGSDGHDLLLRSVMVWQPAVDDFVKRIGLPTSSVSPASLLGARCRTAPENRRHTNDGCRRTGAIRQATEQGTPSTCQRQRQPAPRTAGIESSPIPNALGVVA